MYTVECFSNKDVFVEMCLPQVYSNSCITNFWYLLYIYIYIIYFILYMEYYILTFVLDNFTLIVGIQQNCIGVPLSSLNQFNFTLLQISPSPSLYFSDTCSIQERKDFCRRTFLYSRCGKVNTDNVRQYYL